MVCWIPAPNLSTSGHAFLLRDDLFRASLEDGKSCESQSGAYSGCSLESLRGLAFRSLIRREIQQVVKLVRLTGLKAE